MNKLIQYVIIIVIIIKVESEKIISNLIRFVNLSAKTVVNIGEPQRLFFFDMDLTRNTSLMISPFYNKNDSSTSVYKGKITIIENEKNVQYQIMQDQFHLLDSKYILNDFNFYLTKSTRVTFEAILSLTFKYDDYDYSLVYQLYNKDVIDKKQFGMKITYDILQGTLYLGGLPQKIVGNLVQNTLKVNDKYSTWGFNIKRIIVGKYTFYSNDYVYLQSTQKAIYVKRDFYEFYNNTILREYYDNNTCYIRDIRDYRVKCIGREIKYLPPIEVIIQGYKFRINKNNIFTCFLDICSLDMEIREHWVFGTSFFERYITLFDYDDKSVSFFYKESLLYSNYNKSIIIIVIINSIIIIIDIIKILLL